ncbi:phosphoglucosamine mutase [Arenicella xantha]|uniref:Phosphoglucosamine mutase n=1 Tax=Arenicella xantha TaxID=644221 RepID=A0A395JL17_9GAMM|nr:phosphoglucosamine mutase [Arenicella xantha]RBP51462.1 phosphoglucosamine mutase [Arenicella xantha]
MTTSFFGTDGIRGAVGREPITPQTIVHLGWALGCVIKRHYGKGSILVGKDTRVSGYLLESAMEAGLSSAGMDVVMLGPLPTPAIAYLTQTARANAGVVISASHNAYADNGIKFFSANGTKISDQIQDEIERLMATPMEVVASKDLGKAHRMDDAVGRYVEFCKGTIPRRMDFRGLKVALDCANGAAYQSAPAVFHELGADIEVINNKPNGFNINEGCGSTHIAGLQALVLKEGCDVGIAFDGDADRVLMVDQNGQVVDGDQLLFVIADSLRKQGRLKGGVVGTLMSNFGMERALQEREIPFVRAKVGDRYVMQELVARDWVLGGESSGHIICLDKTTTGDGLVSALQVLTQMKFMQQPLHELAGEMQMYPQTMINVRLPLNTNAAEICQLKDVLDAVAHNEKILSGEGRVLLRPSGTEPVIRVMVEGSDSALVKQCCETISDIVRAQI